MKFRAINPILLICGVLVMSTSCTSTDYKQPISDFSKATQNAETAIIALDRQVTDAYAALLRSQVLQRKGLVQPDDQNCQVTSERCRLVIVDRDRNKQNLTPDPALSKTILLMGSIRLYVESLEAIVNAETAQAVTMQVNATLGSVEALAGTLKKVSGEDLSKSSVSEYTTPVGKLVSWVVGQYVAKVKVDGLRRATGHAQPVIERVADFLNGVASVALDVPKVALAETISKRSAALEDDLSDSNLDKLILSAARYDQFLLIKPNTVFTHFQSAHLALAEKLQNDDLSLADMMAKIKSFASEAKTLATILQELSAAGENDEED